MAITLQLENMVFAGLEVPETINRGGKQQLAVQKLVGGVKIIDAMGRDDDPITWTGLFMGQSANSRAQYLDSLRIAGQPVPLTWGPNNYTVVVSSVSINDTDPNVITYSVTCEVQTDNVTPITPGNLVTADDQIANDMNSAGGLVGSIGDSTLSGLFGTLQTAIKGVSTFANAAQSTIAGVLGPIAAVQSQVKTLLAASVNTVQNIATVGGVLPNTPLAQNVNKLATMSSSLTQQPLLMQLSATMGRVSANVSSVSTNVTTMPTAGGNLMQIAANKYGDASSWTSIAKANGLTDPQLVGQQNIIIPNLADTAGGLLV